MEDYTEEEKRDRPPYHMEECPIPCLAALPPFCERERHGDTDDEHEERLYQVPEIHAVPGMVGELAADESDIWVVLQV